MKKPQVFVLGHRGMLGHTTVRWLRQNGCEVHTSEARYDGRLDCPLVRELVSSPCEAVINCIGLRPGATIAGPELFIVNSLLPQQVSAVLAPERLFIQTSSDGVFAGTRGCYRVEDPPDALDPYGLSKRLGELCVREGNVCVLRTSIIGPERGSERSLLGWFLARDSAVQGYEDQTWNGITSIEWAKLCLRAIRGEISRGLQQAASPRPVSKRALLALIGEAFDHPIPVLSVESGQPINRTLVPTIPCPPIEEQLKELRSWMERA